MTIQQDVLDLDVAPDLRIRYSFLDGEVSRTMALRDREVTVARERLPGSDTDDPFSAWWSSFIRGTRKRQDRTGEPLRYIDLFSSVGGLSLGATDAMGLLGMRGLPLLAADADAKALAVYKQNLRPRVAMAESVNGLVDFRVSGTGADARFAYHPSAQDERLGEIAGTVDLILAGPPCQGHSSLNNHSRHDDPKNALYLTVPAVAVATGARALRD